MISLRSLFCLAGMFLLLGTSGQAQAQTKIVAVCGTNSPGLYPIAATGLPLTMDINGVLCTAGGGGGGAGAVNVTQWDTTALGAPSAYGTSPGAVIVPGFNAFVTNPVAVTQSTSPWVISGSLTDNQSVNVAQFGGISTSTGQVAVNVAPVTATNTALVVGLRPDSPGIITLGPTTPEASVPTVAAGYSYAHIATSTTTTVKSGAGVLHLINVGTLGTVASTITIYDNTAGSGTIIGIINSLTLSGGFPYDVSFATGLTLVTTGTAAPDVTVSYR